MKFIELADYYLEVDLIEYLTNNNQYTYEKSRYIHDSQKYKDGEDVYIMLTRCLGSDREASMFLHNLGYVGIKYKAGTILGGAMTGDVNYVIFDPNDVEIIDREMI